MANFWKEKRVIQLRMRVLYWTKRLKEGRDDPVALEQYARYFAELEELKAERLPKKVVETDSGISKVTPPNFTVTFP